MCHPHQCLMKFLYKQVHQVTGAWQYDWVLLIKRRLDLRSSTAGIVGFLASSSCHSAPRVKCPGESGRYSGIIRAILWHVRSGRRVSVFNWWNAEKISSSLRPPWVLGSVCCGETTTHLNRNAVSFDYGASHRQMRREVAPIDEMGNNRLAWAKFR